MYLYLDKEIKFISSLELRVYSTHLTILHCVSHIFTIIITPAIYNLNKKPVALFKTYINSWNTLQIKKILHIWEMTYRYYRNKQFSNLKVFIWKSNYLNIKNFYLRIVPLVACPILQNKLFINKTNCCRQ